MTNNFLPYIVIQSPKFGEIKLLIDTGANKNYISPKLVPYNSIRLGAQHKITNISGTFSVDKFTYFNPFVNFNKNLPSQKFFLFDFHNFFQGLIGYESLKSLRAVIDTAKDTLRIGSIEVPLHKKFPETININANETKAIFMPTSVSDGDFLFGNEVKLLKNVHILAGLYTSKNHRAEILIHNFSNESQEVSLGDVLNVELNNFEVTSPQKSDSNKTESLNQHIRMDHLNSEERTELTKVLGKFQDVFHHGNEPLTFTSAIQHEINTRDELPVYTKSYRYPFCHKEEVQRQIMKMLEQGIVRHSSSPWSSPVWVVPKKLDASGQRKWRLVIDYRKLNEKTLDDRYPIPNITDILDKLGKCQYFSTLDLASGFHQIELAKKDIHKTAFSVEGGHYEFLRMPFGLKNAPATFQRVMDNILREHVGVICLVYMDDIIIYSTSLQEHLINISKVMETLRKHNLKIQIDKSEFLQKEVAFLGHIVTPEGVKPNPDKIKVIQNWPLPKNETELKGFLGTMGYYRKFIKDFAKIAKPLTQQLRKGEKITHSPEFVSAFNRCKNILTSSHVLQRPDLSKPFVLTTDASNYAIGAVLSQGPIGKDKPIAFASRTLTKSEEKYSTIEKELLAIDWACRYFRPYLFGRKFTLYTDHKPLTYALNMKTSNDRLIRMKLRLEQFDYEIQYRPGKQNVVADGLSRLHHEININPAINANEQESLSSSSDEDKSDDNNDNDDSDSGTVHSSSSDASDLIKMTLRPINVFKNQVLITEGPRNDESYEEIFPSVFRRTITRATFGLVNAISIFRDYMHPTRTSCILCPEKWLKWIQLAYKNYFSRNKSFKVVLTQSILQDILTEEGQDQIIEETHDRAHRGIEDNYKVISGKYFFPRMRNKVTSFVNLCNICLQNKYERNPYKIKFAYTPIPAKPLDIVHMDIFISSPNIFLSAVDKLSRFAMLIPVKSRSIPDIKRGLVKLLTTFRTPKMIVCDNEVAFKAIEIRGLLQRLNIEIYHTPSDHSEVNGIVERFHSTLSEIFRCIKHKFPDLLNKEIYKIATELYNTTIHSATQLTPFEVFFGCKDGDERPLDLPKILENRDELFDEIIQELEARQKKQIDSRNKTREDDPIFEPNQDIFVKTSGIPNKRKAKFRKQKVRVNRRKTVIDFRDIKLHKGNLKRKRKA